MPTEERAMRAREVLAAQCGELTMARQRIERGHNTSVTSTVAIRAMLAFADEGSGIGELLSAIDAWIADPSPETEQGIMDARTALSQSN